MGEKDVKQLSPEQLAQLGRSEDKDIDSALADILKTSQKRKQNDLMLPAAMMKASSQMGSIHGKIPDTSSVSEYANYRTKKDLIEEEERQKMLRDYLKSVSARNLEDRRQKGKVNLRLLDHRLRVKNPEVYQDVNLAKWLTMQDIAQAGRIQKQKDDRQKIAMKGPKQGTGKTVAEQNRDDRNKRYKQATTTIYGQAYDPASAKAVRKASTDMSDTIKTLQALKKARLKFIENMGTVRDTKMAALGYGPYTQLLTDARRQEKTMSLLQKSVAEGALGVLSKDDWKFILQLQPTTEVDQVDLAHLARMRKRKSVSELMETGKYTRKQAEKESKKLAKKYKDQYVEQIDAMIRGFQGKFQARLKEYIRVPVTVEEFQAKRRRGNTKTENTRTPVQLLEDKVGKQEKTSPTENLTPEQNDWLNKRTEIIKNPHQQIKFVEGSKFIDTNTGWYVHIYEDSDKVLKKDWYNKTTFEKKK